MERRRTDNSGFVSATELAQMGFCETQMVLKHVVGDQATPEQVVRRKEGRVVHAEFHDRVVADHNRQRPESRDRRCFIATAVYGGDDARTQELRSWRDRVLSQSRAGRLGIRLYYALSPMVANWLVRGRVRRRVACLLLDLIREMIRATERPQRTLEKTNEPSHRAAACYGRGEV